MEGLFCEQDSLKQLRLFGPLKFVDKSRFDSPRIRTLKFEEAFWLE
jgi:hypothetical protein